MKKIITPKAAVPTTASPGTGTLFTTQATAGRGSATLTATASTDGRGAVTHGTVVGRDNLPPVEDVVSLLRADISPPPVLVDGLIHTGSKAVIGGGSKAFKSWSLLHLAVSVATGTEWFGRQTHEGRVLLINLELQRPFIRERLAQVLAARNLTLSPGMFDLWHLRGHAGDLSRLLGPMLAQLKNRHYAMIIIDPIYKFLGDRDENSAGDISGLMNDLERLAQATAAAVAFSAHFSKGNQAARDSIDRIGGSGVFARDPDTILIVTPHEEPNAFVVEPTLRNFAPMKPFCVRWQHPLVLRDDSLNPARIKQKSRRSAKAPTDEEFLSLFPDERSDHSPRQALLSHGELEQECRLRGFNKNVVAGCRNRLERQGKIGVVREGNKVLAGRPDAIAAFQKARLAPDARAGRVKLVAEVGHGVPHQQGC